MTVDASARQPARAPENDADCSKIQRHAAIRAISSDKHCGFGQAGTFSDNLVEVEKVAVPFLAAAE